MDWSAWTSFVAAVIGASQGDGIEPAGAPSPPDAVPAHAARATPSRTVPASWSRTLTHRTTAPTSDVTPAGLSAAGADALPEFDVLAPRSATSPDGTLSVTVVASSDPLERQSAAVHALVARSGALVQWTPLPLERLPEAVIAPDAERFVCIERDALGATSFTTIDVGPDADARLRARAQLEELVPGGARRDLRAPITLAANDRGTCLAVTMSCGSVAFIEVAVMPGHDYEVCGIDLSPRFACGIDAWLEQARELYREGDQHAERFALEAAIETDPDSARGYRAMARYFDRIDDHESRVRCLQLGVDRVHAEANGAVTERWQVGSPAARLVVEYAEAVRDAFGDDRAQEALDEVLALYPCMEQAVLMRAEIHFDGGDDRAALQWLYDALSRLSGEEDVAAAYHDVGRFLSRMERQDQALAFLQEAYELGDRSEFLIRGIAGLYCQRDEHAVAAEWLTRLADHWRTLSNGDSELERRLRGYQRLADLEKEIDALLAEASTDSMR
ncbi:MAG: hypothetical protein AAGB93_07030 [Planctomycetota bacterium]